MEINKGFTKFVIVLKNGESWLLSINDGSLECIFEYIFDSNKNKDVLKAVLETSNYKRDLFTVFDPCKIVGDIDDENENESVDCVHFRRSEIVYAYIK